MTTDESQMINTMTHGDVNHSQLMKFHRSPSVPLTEADLFPGDHVYVKRTTRHYQHHGIYIGHGKVIHISGSIREKRDPEVRESELSTFLNGGKLRRRNYTERLPASETIQIAKQQLHNTSFSIFRNNCEHFATFCVTGKKKSRQVRKLFYGLTTATAGIALLALTRIFSQR